MIVEQISRDPRAPRIAAPYLVVSRPDSETAERILARHVAIGAREADGSGRGGAAAEARPVKPSWF
jgi:hypothetical protein